MDKKILIQKAELLKAISNPIRLCLVSKLLNEEKLNVSYFTNCMEVSQSNISQHLAKLRDLNILESEKEGQNVYYSLKNKMIKSIVEIIIRRN